MLAHGVQWEKQESVITWTLNALLIICVFLALPLINCVALGKFLSCPEFQVSHLKTECLDETRCDSLSDLQRSVAGRNVWRELPMPPTPLKFTATHLLLPMFPNALKSQEALSLSLCPL